MIAIGFVATWGVASVALGIWAGVRVRHSASSDDDFAAATVRSLGVFYWFLVAGLGALCVFASFMIATNA